MNPPLEVDRLADRMVALEKENALLRYGANLVIPLIEAAGREEVTDVLDWDTAETILKAAIQKHQNDAAGNSPRTGAASKPEGVCPPLPPSGTLIDPENMEPFGPNNPPVGVSS